MKRLLTFVLFSAALAGLIAVERCTPTTTVAASDAAYVPCGEDGGEPCFTVRSTTDVMPGDMMERLSFNVGECFGDEGLLEVVRRRTTWSGMGSSAALSIAPVASVVQLAK